MSEVEKKYLEKAEARRRVNLSFAEAGVEFFDLSMAQIDEGVKIGAGTLIGPGVIITGKTVIGANCIIGQGSELADCFTGDVVEINHSVLKGSSIGEGTQIGPFANIRPGSVIGRRCRIGDFVEIKNSTLGDDVRVSHLTYIGDSDLGNDINVGCGVVFVNYDGAAKHRSSVGDGAFIGCNVNLVSPVSIGAGAYIAAGGTVTSDVPADALFIARDRGRISEGWVTRRGLKSAHAYKKEGEKV